MKFLCGRPGCGENSTVTLQIDAPSCTVTLLDPRVSRDGVPLCSRHAESTTPPVGWSMNDMRSHNHRLSAVPTGDDVPLRVPKVPQRSTASDDSSQEDTVKSPGERRIRAVRSPLSEAVHRNQSSAESAQRPQRRTVSVPKAEVSSESTARLDLSEDSRFASSRPEGETLREETAAEKKSGLSSRPARRREVTEEPAVREEKFPWHHQFSDDEPEELQAESPLLSRAFRYTVG